MFKFQIQPNEKNEVCFNIWLAEMRQLRFSLIVSFFSEQNSTRVLVLILGASGPEENAGHMNQLLLLHLHIDLHSLNI